MNQISLRQGIYKIAAYAVPISAASLVNIIASFVGMLMVARLGKIELAAGALAVSTYITLMTIAVTSLYAIGILISHFTNYDENASAIGNIVKNGIWFACLLAIPAGLILWHANYLLLLFGQSKNLVAIAKPYFHFAALTLFPTLIAVVISQFYIGIGKPRFSVVTSIIRLPFIILLSFGFVFGKFGLPHLGLAGLMCASFIVQSLYCICLGIYLYCRKNMQKFKLFAKPLVPDWIICKKIFFLGMPIGLQFGGELGAMAIATYMLGAFGVSALAASQIVSQYVLIVVVVVLGLSQALSVLTSNAYGRNDYNLARKYLSATLVILSGAFVFVAMIFIFLPDLLVGLFIRGNHLANMRIIELAIYFFAIAAVVLFIDGIRNILSGALRGLHDSSSPMKLGISCLWLISLPICYLVGFVLHGGPVGLRIGFGSGFIIACILLYLRLRKKWESNHGAC